MVDASKYVKQNTEVKRIDVKLVEDQLPTKRKAVILPGAFYREFDKTNSDGSTQKVSKLVLLVDFLEETHEWVINKSTSELLQKEIGSSDTDDWVGAVIKFIINDNNKMRWLTATLISPPTGGSFIRLSKESERFIRETKSYE